MRTEREEETQGENKTIEMNEGEKSGMEVEEDEEKEEKTEMNRRRSRIENPYARKTLTPKGNGQQKWKSSKRC